MKHELTQVQAIIKHIQSDATEPFGLFGGDYSIVSEPNASGFVRVCAKQHDRLIGFYNVPKGDTKEIAKVVSSLLDRCADFREGVQK